MAKSVAHQRAEDRLSVLLGATYDAQWIAERLHDESRDPAVASAMRLLAEAAENLERTATRAARPTLRLVA